MKLHSRIHYLRYYHDYYYSILGLNACNIQNRTRSSKNLKENNLHVYQKYIFPGKQQQPTRTKYLLKMLHSVCLLICHLNSPLRKTVLTEEYCPFRHLFITKTCPCNIQEKFLAVKMKIFIGKILIFFLFLLKT